MTERLGKPVIISPTIKISKSLPLLNYVAFLTLFITSFVFLFQKNTAILGYALLFITNTVSMIYVSGELLPKLDLSMSYFVPILATIAVVTSSILHFVCLIFVLMMIYKLHVKYTVTNGLPINIPPPYDEQLHNFNVLMLTTFCLSSALVFILKFRSEKLDINLYELLKRMNIYLVLRNTTFFLTLGLAISVIVISSIQVNTANGFAKLTRRQLNVAEQKAIQKNKNIDLRINPDQFSDDLQLFRNQFNTSFLINA